MLRIYRNQPHSVLMSHEDLMWVHWYVAEALKTGEVNDAKKKGTYLRANKLCCLAFARVYGLMSQWKEKHSEVSLWSPYVDFRGAGHKLRIVGVPANESGKWKSFGSTLSARVWDRDFQKGHTGYVLACWFPPYVDIVGWMTRTDLLPYREKTWYRMEESIVRPMSTLSGFTPAV